MSKIEVDTIDTQSSTTLQVGSTNTALIKIGTSGDTVEYPAGTTFTQSGTQNVTAGGAINVKSGGSIIIDSGAAITNNGTATGFSADLTNLNATNLTSGTVPGARFPATLPIANGSALTNLNATNLGSGTVPDARFPATLPAISGANLTNLPAGGITEADMWRITTAFSGSVQPITANWERCDEDTFAKIGTGMSVSSGIWSFPITGLYQVVWNCSWDLGAAVSRYVYSELITTNDNSTYTERGVGWTSIFNGSSTTYTSATISVFVNVSNVSNQKIKLGVNVDNSSVNTRGSSTANQSYVSFIRLGDSQ